MFVFLVLLATFLNKASLISSQQVFAGWVPPTPAPETATQIPNIIDFILPHPSFSFPSFNFMSCAQNSPLNCTGSTSAGMDNTLRLTPAKKNKVGKVMYRYPVTAWPSYFSTNFTIRIVQDPSSSRGSGGDGMTFIMAGDNAPPPGHSCGSNLGIINKSSKDNKNLRQIAVEMDTHKDKFDIDDNHIAIDISGVKKPLVAKSLSDIGVDFKSGRDIKFRVEYNGKTKWMQIFASYASDPLMLIVSVQIDISAIVPKFAFVGFTASTGSSTEIHQLLSWEFKSTIIT